MRDELKALIERANQGQKPKRRRSSEEANLQKACIRWFRLQHPTLAPLLFSVPNGGSRDKREAAELKRQGVVAGVADLILLKGSKDRRFSALCVEVKAKVGRQSISQKEWEKYAKAHGNRYVVVRSVEEFIQVVNDHLWGIRPEVAQGKHQEML